MPPPQVGRRAAYSQPTTSFFAPAGYPQPSFTPYPYGEAPPRRGQPRPGKPDGGQPNLARSSKAVYGLVTVVGAGIARPLLLRHVGSLDSWRITRSLVRMVLATVPGLLWVLAVMAVAGSALRQGTFYGLASVIIGGGGAVLLYALCARMLRIDEFTVLTRTMTRRLA